VSAKKDARTREHVTPAPVGGRTVRTQVWSKKKGEGFLFVHDPAGPDFFFFETLSGHRHDAYEVAPTAALGQRPSRLVDPLLLEQLVHGLQAPVLSHKPHQGAKMAFVARRFARRTSPQKRVGHRRRSGALLLLPASFLSMAVRSSSSSSSSIGSTSSPSSSTDPVSLR